MIDLVVVTEMSATGHVFVRILDDAAASKPVEINETFYGDGTSSVEANWCIGRPIVHSKKPGTLEAVGKWSYLSEMEVLDPCSCGQTFLCVGCNQLVGSCSVIGDDAPDLCNDCWDLKQIMKEKLAPGM